MKTAIWIEQGVVQLALTPENDFEQNAIKAIAEDKTSLQIFSGTFYDCVGGWTRQRPEGDSLLIRVEKEPKPKATNL